MLNFGETISHFPNTDLPESGSDSENALVR
jgi:hypothetical protein